MFFFFLINDLLFLVLENQPNDNFRALTSIFVSHRIQEKEIKKFISIILIIRSTYKIPVVNLTS